VETSTSPATSGGGNEIAENNVWGNVNKFAAVKTTNNN